MPTADSPQRIDTTPGPPSRRHGTTDRGRQGDDAQPAEGVTFLSCHVADAVRIGLEAAGGKNREVFSPTIGRRLLDRGLIDEIDLHIAPVLLGDGIRLFDNPGGFPVQLELLNGDDRSAGVNVRYRPVAAG
ncbi:dihydrofolate reductase family protein [Streptomyces sp. DT2A-34]|uniref:dihydrofolate reductase family protein n=1 Tax=Streptomyces sp. DT2A-34 TaxID=3051182 RepID=UPI00265BC758|nr:dihydrofolate reductase family protein [Streptomyces sp. DT2A-34]MDO0914878.1 dihydrofolate reductase family protein [Streptomyces sp. DT2A-34]